jgi:guanylate kinase
MHKLVLLSAPSGSGKTTLTRHLLEGHPEYAFSVSATSRPPRGAEKHGVDYYFLSNDAFDAAVANGDFLEWEEVYPGAKYGTLKQEVDRLWADGKVVFFDMDVEGALRLKRQFGEQALAVYIEAPSMEILEQRLRNRGTDTEEKIQIRLGKAALEAQRAPLFDVRIVNDELDRATQALRSAVDAFLTDSGLDRDSASDSSSAAQPA